MGVGGLVTGIMGATGGGPHSSPPNPNRVGRDFSALLSQYLNRSGDIYNNEAQYQPLYNLLGIQNQSASRSAGVEDVNRLAPGMYTAMRGYNPQGTGLLDQLGVQASDQLRQNGGLDPAMQRQVQQNVRSSQAARGVGYGPGDAVQEQFYENQTMEQRRRENQQFAGNVAAQEANTYRDPFSLLAGVSGRETVTPQIVSPQQSDSMMGTVYNARAASNIANQNSDTAMLQGFNSFD